MRTDSFSARTVEGSRSPSLRSRDRRHDRDRGALDDAAGTSDLSGQPAAPGVAHAFAAAAVCAGAAGLVRSPSSRSVRSLLPPDSQPAAIRPHQSHKVSDRPRTDSRTASPSRDRRRQGLTVGVSAACRRPAAISSRSGDGRAAASAGARVGAHSSTPSARARRCEIQRARRGAPSNITNVRMT